MAKKATGKTSKRTKLTDKDKKQIIADYVKTGNKSLTAKKNKVSVPTVTRICDADPETKKKVEAVAEKNTISILDHMEGNASKRMELIDDLIEAMVDKAKDVDMFTNIKDLGTVYGIMVDKDLKFGELQKYKADTEDRLLKYIPAKDVAKCFADVNRSIDDREYREYWLEGGRGSTKSSFISEKVIEIIENDEDKCALCLRKVANTLKDSVYAQIEWALEQLAETYPNIKTDYKLTKSPLEITKMSTNQKIYFRGADDPGKIKSIKPPKGKYIGVLWYEEFDQFGGMAEIRKINQSIIRGGEDFVLLYSYNTPPSSQHFVNREKIIPKESRICHLSDYRDVPKKWLGQAFIDEAEYIRDTNDRVYRNEYLGEMTGAGDNVFENLEIREITDEEIQSFDYIYQGLDFGWYPDPLAWGRVSFKSNERILYVFDELVVNKMSNKDVWEKLSTEKNVQKSDMIMADSAEPKSIGDFRGYGSSMRGVEKGPGSVNYSIKWLQGLTKIIIDPRRCPRTTEEFSNYTYEKDKEGNIITGYPDKDNHCIDYVRYATNRIWKKRGK